MYRKKSNLQNLSIIAIDCVSISVSFFGSNYLRHHSLLEYGGGNNSVLGVLAALLLSYLFLYLLFNMNSDFAMRGYIVEAFSVFKQNVIITVMTICIIYFTRIVMDFSRGVMGFFMILDTILMYCLHQVFKFYLRHIYKNSKKNRQLLLVTVYDYAKDVLDGLTDNGDWDFKIAAVALLDRDEVGEEICGVPVVAGRDDLVEYCKHTFLDEAYFYTHDIEDEATERLVRKLFSMGITVHLNIDLFRFQIGAQKTVSKIGSYYAVTLANKILPLRSVMIKRMMDIAGALFGLCFTGLVTLSVGPLIKLESKGPIFYSQIRVGKNGRFFKMYKFRSMYADAEKRKAELEARNESDGYMFKIADDPRVTKIGRFLRKTSLDECPQFLNVLKGDMSLVGTRPPTLDEFEKYRSYHKKRLSITPGLTGLWQISGRSKITDFEEVVRLDVEYIDNWSLGLDIKIILKTIGVVLRGEGAK